MTDLQPGAAPNAEPDAAKPAPSAPPKPGGLASSVAAGGVDYAPHRRRRSAGLRHIARRARERTVVHGYRACELAVGRIPPHISGPVARSLFLGGYWGWPAKRRIVLANAAHVLGRSADDPEVASLARRIYAGYAHFAVDLMRLPSRPPQEPLQLVHGPEELGPDSFMGLWERCRSEGRGIIAVSGHIGSIEVFAGAFALRGVPTCGLADDSEYPELFERLTAMRRRWGVEIIPWRNLREVYRALRRPAVLGLVVDWGYRDSDLPVRLFGQWTTLPAGPATLAARTGSLILPVVNRRQGDGTYAATHAAPIEVADASAAALLHATQGIADALEAMVREAPEQWFTFKPMWPATDAEAAALEARAQRLMAR
jgi:phosphatidylinositol dimannoside acyltransferase